MVKPISTLIFEDGTTRDFELLSIFDGGNGRRYAALWPSRCYEGEYPAVNLYRIEPGAGADGEGYEILPITSYEELEEARNAFDLLNVEIPSVKSEADDANGEGAEGDDIILTFRDADGHMREWQLIDAFEAKGREYVALLPLDGDAEGEINIHLFRMSPITQGEVEGLSITTIPSDLEYDTARAEFERRVYIAE